MKTVGEALGPAVDADEDDKVDIRTLTQAQLMQLGMADLAYVKPVWMNGTTAFAVYAADGKQLVLARGTTTSDVVLISNFR